MRVGIGYDVHKLVEERDLILGGVKIPFEKGLLGHSDADVLLHSICDALLGAAGEGDIGRHFPDSDSKYKGISSLKLLGEVNNILKAVNYMVSNIDASIICQRPKLSPHIDCMVENISSELGIETKQVNIKATTTEGLGFAGRKEGIAAYSVAMIMPTS